MNKTHAIITYSKTHYLIDNAKNEELQDKHIDDVIEIDGSLVKIRNIAEVMTISKYYETYPGKRNDYVERYKELPGMGMEGIIRASRESAIKGIIKGLKNYISSNRYQGTEAPKKLLALAELRLNNL